MAKFQFWLPTDTSLTRIQRRAVDAAQPIFLSGVPGTGKTVVSIKRLQNAAGLNKKAIIFTFGKLLKKTIEEKLDNNPKMLVKNIHDWMWWDVQDKNNKKYLEVLISDENREQTTKMIKDKEFEFDEILVDEGQDLSLNTYKILKELTPSLSISADNAQQINNQKEATNEEEILEYFPNLERYELDEVFRSAYELYRFAIQFVPYNARANDERLLERLKKKNSGADKPFVWLENNLDSVFDTIKDIIDENPTDNIGILFEKTLHVDECEKRLSSDYEVSKYHNQEVIPSQLNNVIITTFKSAKGIEFDYVIIPYFPAAARNLPEDYYVGVTRAKNQVHFIAINELPKLLANFDKNTYELVDNRG